MFPFIQTNITSQVIIQVEVKGLIVLGLCSMYYYNAAQRYEQFLQVGRLYRALILLDLALSSKRLCVLDLHGAIYMLQFFCLHPSIHLLVNRAWWDWPLMWLINHCPSVL